MSTHKVKKLPKRTAEIIIDIPKEDIIKEYKLAFNLLLKDLTVEGFRKGKVPKNIGEKHLKKEEVYQTLIKNVLPKIFEDIVKKESLTPVISPKIELVKAKEDENWQIKMTVAEKPTVMVGDYKEIVRKAKANLKKDDIWLPGKGQEPEKTKVEKEQKMLNTVLAALLKEAKLEMSDLIVEEELNRKLAQQVDEIQKIGLTVDAYLKSKGLTMEQLKQRYAQEINDTYKIEFVLQEIADKEGIKVEESDLDKLFGNIKDEKEKALAKQNAYFYASILRKQKTLDFLLGL